MTPSLKLEATLFLRERFVEKALSFILTIGEKEIVTLPLRVNQQQQQKALHTRSERHGNFWAIWTASFLPLAVVVPRATYPPW